MAEGMPIVTVMMSVGMQLGSRWRMMMRRLLPPSMRHACTYSFSLSWSTVPRMSRAVFAQESTPSAIYRLTSPRPSANISAIASSRSGRLEHT